MQAFKSKFTRIQEGFSSNRRIPRLGKIRLGIKVKHPNTEKEYPKETSHFVVPAEVAHIYGEEPTVLDVMLPCDDEEIIFPQKLAMFGRSKGLTCQGNGRQAERLNEKTKQWEPRVCPCEHRKTNENPKGACTENAHLMVLLPKVNLGGVYQITTGSYNSVVDINSGLEYVRGLLGRVAMVPLKLKREKRETHHGGKKQTHYTMTLTLDADIQGINQLREDTNRVLERARFQIEGPLEENPSMTPSDVIDVPVNEVGPVSQDEFHEEPQSKPEGGEEVEILEVIRGIVNSLAESSAGLKALGHIHKNFRVRDFTKVKLEDRSMFLDAVNEAKERLQENNRHG